MQPFGELRSWLSRATTSEKTMTGMAVGTALALLVWLLVPAGPAANSAGPGFPGSDAASSSAGSGATGAQSAPAGPAAGSGGGVGSVGGGSGPAVAGGGGGPGATTTTSTDSGGGAAGASSAPGSTTFPSCGESSAAGVTSTSIKIAVTIAEIVGPAGNQTFGLPTVAQQKQKYDTVIDAVNAEGGVACRKVIPVYYSVNPADQSDMHAKCLDIADDNPFAVIDDGGEYAGADCFGQHHIPFIAENLLFTNLASEYYPYLMSAYDFYDNAYRVAVAGLQQRGFFDAGQGFRKLGFMYFDCHPELIDEMTSSFHRAGLSDDQIVGYDAGCPSPPLASPSDLQQAVLRFKSAGVTNVTFAYFFGSIGNFTNIAEQQGFRPKYGLADDGYIGVSYGTSRPNRQNFDGAITITTSRYGEENTPGYSPTPGTAACNRIFVEAEMTPIYQQPAPSNGGWVCDLVWMLRAGADHARSLSQDALAGGLAAARSLDFSYPGGPNDFAATHGVAGGGGWWRVAQFAGACRCWKLAVARFHG